MMCEATRHGRLIHDAPATLLDLRCPHCRTHIIIAVCDRHERMRCLGCGRVAPIDRWQA